MTLWQGVTALTLGKNEFREYRSFRGKAGCHEDRLAQPNPIRRTSFSIVKTLTLEQPDEMRVFYRRSKGAGALGTIYAVRMKETG